ncbi:hypothetical protein ACIBI8_20540 [Streptomyces sp. NPDC050529]|uniref:hypothetical protein n=1 Tax=Streptomyces sp. NPDC050529 TaxID=3365624 RepID=UPI0037BCCB59
MNGTDDARQHLSWPTEGDETWAARFTLALTLEHYAPEGLRERTLAEVHDVAVESGMPAQELFGDPDDYAATVAVEGSGPDHRSTLDVNGLPPGSHFTGAVLLTGGLAMLFGVFLWFQEGFRLPVGWGSGIAAALLGALFVLTLGVIPELRAAGRLRSSWIAAGCAFVLLVATATGFAAVPPGTGTSVPAPVLCLIGALLAALGWRLPEERVGQWFNGRRASAATMTDEAWLARFAALLRGRHRLSPELTRQHTAEVRDHLRASGGNAADEFGRPEIHALRLAEGPGRRERAARALLWPQLLMSGALCWYAVDLFGAPDPASWWFWVRAVALPLAVWGTISQLRTHWQDRRDRQDPRRTA